MNWRIILRLIVLSLCTQPAVAELSIEERQCISALRTKPQETDDIFKHHALALHGSPKYPENFKHFDYVNPNAPKGGVLRLASEGSFDSFNPFNSKGTPVNPGVFETLMVSSEDEAFSEYGLLAENIEYPADRSWVIFNLRAEARWQDGKPVSADDVIFSFNTLREKGAPFYRFYYGNVSGVEKLNNRRVRFNFANNKNRELPLILGQLPILPMHWWSGRDFSATLLDPPLGSGPYKIASYEPGRFIERTRHKNYWGRNLAVNRGLNNFDRIRIDYYRDRIAIREAVKAGAVDYFLENQAKAWAVDWTTPAIQQKKLIKKLVTESTPQGMQAFVMNTRREIFQDIRVRKALNLAFDFEWTNKNLFFGQYKRSYSFFSNSELAASGEAEGEERAALKCLAAYFPEEILTAPATLPATDGSGWSRENLRQAFRLLNSAGWSVKDMKLVNEKTNRQFKFEFLLVSPAFERIVLPFKRNLERLGMEVSVRLVDQSQYINRLRQFDFDMIVSGWGQSESPGSEQRDYWGSNAADREGSRNFIGIQNTGIDTLIELLIEAPDRESLIARTHALDRALLAGQWIIPNWHIAAERIVYWDKFGQPKVTPYKGVSINTWWFDQSKASKLLGGN
ncbi:MAG: extracellular solute-binding protein [Alphaproteobacteria bacterium]